MPMTSAPLCPPPLLLKGARAPLVPRFLRLRNVEQNGTGEPKYPKVAKFLGFRTVINLKVCPGQGVIYATN